MPSIDAVALRPLLSHLQDDDDGRRLAAEGGRAFVSQSLRPYLVAAARRLAIAAPALVVAGDDRQARDLAGDLRHWLAPRPVRFYPEPRRHLRVAPRAACAPRRPPGRRARRPAEGGGRDAEAPVVVVSAPSRSARRSPTRSCGRARSRIRKGDLLDLDEVAGDLVAAGYERVDQVDDRGQFAVRGGILDVYPGDRGPRRRASTCSTSRSSRCAGSRRSPSARSATPTRSRSRPRPSSPPSTASSPRSRRSDGGAPRRRRAAAGRPLPRVPGLAPERGGVLIAAEEEVEPALADHWQDVCAAFHDADAHHLYVKPGR